jgi:hypothetical protein
MYYCTVHKDLGANLLLSRCVFDAAVHIETKDSVKDREADVAAFRASFCNVSRARLQELHAAPQ